MQIQTLDQGHGLVEHLVELAATVKDLCARQGALELADACRHKLPHGFFQAGSEVVFLWLEKKN